MFKLVGLQALLLLGTVSVAQPEILFAASGNTRLIAKEKIYYHTLGSTPVAVQVATYGDRRNIVMLNLHDDEVTSVIAARNVLQSTGGILVTINNNYERLVSFTLKGKTWKFDPNRMFSRDGIISDLLKHNQQSNLSAVKAIEGFAKFLMGKVPKTSTLIALHNNDQHNFSVISYKDNEKYSKSVQALHTNDDHDADNFFLTTDKKLYQSLRAAGYNVILQHKRPADDGSLSVYFGRKNKSYVNVEAETGRVKEQEEMIVRIVSWINKSIPKSRT